MPRKARRWFLKRLQYPKVANRHKGASEFLAEPEACRFLSVAASTGQGFDGVRRLECQPFISEPKRGRRNWQGKDEEKRAVYGNRRRVRGKRGRALLRLRGERSERTFAHCYETGGMRRPH